MLLRLFFEVHKHLLVILNLLKVRESWVIWNVFQFVATGDWSTSSQKLIAGIWEDMLVKGFMSDIHLPDRYFVLGVSPYFLGVYDPFNPRQRWKVFILHKALGSLTSHLSINFGGG